MCKYLPTYETFVCSSFLKKTEMGSSSSKTEYVYIPAPRPPTPPRRLTDKPWRYSDDIFTELYEEKLKSDMNKAFKTSSAAKRANVLLLGPIKAGKSSFINSVASVVKGRLADVSQAGSAATSFTLTYDKYAPRSGFMKNVRLFDCMGIERHSGGFNVNDVKYLVNGNVPMDYPFNPASPITPKDKRFITNPEEKDKIHCILYVIDAEALYGEIPDDLVKKIADLQEELKQSKLPRIMVLTKIDKLCDEVNQDVAKAYRSFAVKDMVKKAAELFGLSEALIYPVRNYADTPEMDHKANVLILLALQKLLNFAEDYLEKQTGEEDSD